ncbi:hypothetical protein MCHI_000465 [Candidatus Magnetoovum chiemensis]|nr:hypothetical protein MCHI_000465 [Candidatus Magnetoovum chiemensis]
MKRLSIIIASLFIANISCSKQSSLNPVTFNSSGEFIVSVSDFKDNSPVFYGIMKDNVRVAFFLVKVNGIMRSYFNVCATCRAYGRGYRAQEYAIVCNNCGVRIPYDELKNGIGGCYPFKLKGHQKDGDGDGNGKYVINKRDIIEGVRHF